MRYAWLVTTNDTYWPSVYAMINALEYYEYPLNLDVHIIHTPEAAEFISGIKNNYRFNIVSVPIELLVQATTPPHSVPHTLIYGKYKHAWNIRNVYDAIFHIDGDCMILANFMKYFEIAGKTDLIPCAQFPHTIMNIEDYKLKQADYVHTYTPLANFPIFYNPKHHADVMKAIWDMQPDELKCSDPLRNVEMYFFNKALYDHGRMDRIVQLPGNLWVTDAFVGHTPIQEMVVAGKRTLFNATTDRIQIIHNKWWKPGHAEGEISRSPNKELCRANIAKMMAMFDFLTLVKSSKTATTAREK